MSSESNSSADLWRYKSQKEKKRDRDRETDRERGDITRLSLKVFITLFFLLFNSSSKLSSLLKMEGEQDTQELKNSMDLYSSS